MFLKLAHTKLQAYEKSESLVITCYKITKKFPGEEKFALVQQIRRASMSVFLNLSEGCSRKSSLERTRFFEICRGSLIEVDSAFNIAVKLGFVTTEELSETGELIIVNFKLISGLITGNKTHN